MRKIYIVGVGSGNYNDLTIKALEALEKSDYVYCDEKIYEKLKLYLDERKIIYNSYNKTEERYINAIAACSLDKTISIVSSGDPGIYGISSLILNYVDKLDEEIDIEILPGITSALSGAALLGSPLTQDFAVITLSDKLAKSKELQNKIISMANLNMSIVFYSPKNPTDKNIHLAKEILINYRSGDTVVGLVKNIGSKEETIIYTTLDNLNIEDICNQTTIFVGNKETKLTKSNKMITPLL